MKHLSDIADLGNSDKGRRFHAYTDKYHGLFSPFRLKPITFLEIGILGGDSITMWADFFPHPKTRIIGVDIHDRGYRLTRDNRVELYFGDINQLSVQARLPYSIDCLLDDGPHVVSQQIDTFNALWSRVKPGGMYLIEDLHSVHSVQHCDAHINIIEYMAKLAIEMQDPAGATGSAKYNPDHPWSDIASIELSKGLAVIRKRL